MIITLDMDDRFYQKLQNAKQAMGVMGDATLIRWALQDFFEKHSADIQEYQIKNMTEMGGGNDL